MKYIWYVFYLCWFSYVFENGQIQKCLANLLEISSNHKSQCCQKHEHGTNQKHQCYRPVQMNKNLEIKLKHRTCQFVVGHLVLVSKMFLGQSYWHHHETSATTWSAASFCGYCVTISTQTSTAYPHDVKHRNQCEQTH